MHCFLRQFSVTFLIAAVGSVSAQQPYDAKVVADLVDSAKRSGNPARGAVLYASPTSACLSCHKVGKHGGTIGPDLTEVGKKQKLFHIAESIVYPKKVVDEKYEAVSILTFDGEIKSGYIISKTDEVLTIRDSTTGKDIEIAQEDVEVLRKIGTVMPDGLLATYSEQDKLDLIAFLGELGHHKQVSAEAIDSLLGHSHGHHPATFEVTRDPLEPERWPSWKEHVNRDRVYDFYRKQARHFRDVEPRPSLLAEFPGLDGGSYGHWGNQSDPVWADGRWNESDLGSLLCGVFRGPGVTVARGICVRIGTGKDAVAACFDPDRLRYVRFWKDGFVKFTDVRAGFMQGLNQDGRTIDAPAAKSPVDANSQDTKFIGMYRHGRKVIFSYRVDGAEYLDCVSLVDGKLKREIAPRDQHSMASLTDGGGAQWDQTFVTSGKLGKGGPYAVDKIELPVENPWKALLYCAGHDFLSDGSAIITTMQGDVWRASGIDAQLKSVTWRRIASGLQQPLGVVVENDQIFVIGRDRLTRLHDLDGDGEIDFYENYSDALATSAGGHDFTCGLARDPNGRFYTASGKQGVMRIASDGQSAAVVATGLRNSDGIGRHPDGMLTIPSSEGDWMPASMIAAVRPDGPVLNRIQIASQDADRGVPFFGRPGLGRKHPPELPMLYLPRGLDNSSGGQVFVKSDRWGAAKDNMVHLSFGAGRAFLLLRDEFDGWVQGAVVPIAGEFASGAHRGRFNPIDGQLYVSGMGGWGTYTTDDGSFERVRFTGDTKPVPIGFHIHENGIKIEFSSDVDEKTVQRTKLHLAQAWNYRYSGAYGSPEYSTRQLGLRGHDVLEITSAHVVDNGRTVFVEIPDLQPVNQLHLLLQTSSKDAHDLFMTVHRLDEPFVDFDGYQPKDKIVLPHPILADLARPLVAKRNPHRKALQNARPITIKAAKNLMFDRTEFKVKVGEPIRLTFENPDAVPHNWALLKPGTLKSVGELTNKLIADPEAAANHYIPKTDDVLAFTDVVAPYAKFTIYFSAPKQPGKYPFLCTFPGHWMVMNGTMVVEP